MTSNLLQLELGERNMEQRKNLAKMEQELVQAKLNPHFIFNCLNGILTFVYSKDYETIKHYLPKLARLIRASIELSKNNFINVSTEQRYLQDYLDLEKMRFPNLFTFEIIVEPTINTEIACIPTLMLQIFVENALVHGIGGLKGSRAGTLKVHFYPVNEFRIGCTITDNGVGYPRGKKLEAQTNAEILGEKRYSMGHELNKRRIALLEELFDARIEFSVSDHLEAANGTVVTFTFPLFHTENTNFR